MPKLTIISLGFGDQSCDLPDGRFTVGRAPRNMIVIDDPSVSSDHCELLVYGNEVIVREVGSRNGTFINNQPVQSQSGVKHGQTIRFGRVEARVELDERSASEATTLTTIAYNTRVVAPPMASGISDFPITFAPFGQGGAMGETMIFTAKIRNEPLPVAVAAATARDEHRSHVWMIVAALGALLLVLLWQFFR